VTRKALGIAPGSPEAKVIDDHIAQRKRSGTVKSIALAVLGIGLGLIAIFATGGLATIALVAGAGMSVYNVATDYKKYGRRRRARTPPRSPRPWRTWPSRRAPSTACSGPRARSPPARV